MEALDPSEDSLVECWDGVRRPKPRIDPSVKEQSPSRSGFNNLQAKCKFCSDQHVLTLTDGKQVSCPRCHGGKYNG